MKYPYIIDYTLPKAGSRYGGRLKPVVEDDFIEDGECELLSEGRDDLV